MTRKHLESVDTEYSINPRMVRGLDYYTRTTFELVTGLLGAQSAVAAGGRYDGLIEDLGGQVFRVLALPWVPRGLHYFLQRGISARQPDVFICRIGRGRSARGIQIDVRVAERRAVQWKPIRR